MILRLLKFLMGMQNAGGHAFYLQSLREFYFDELNRLDTKLTNKSDALTALAFMVGSELSIVQKTKLQLEAEKTKLGDL